MNALHIHAIYLKRLNQLLLSQLIKSKLANEEAYLSYMLFYTHFCLSQDLKLIK